MWFSFIDVILNFVEDYFMSVDAISLIIDVAFLRLAGPGMASDHVEIGLGWLFKFLIFFESMSIEAIVAPSQ